MPTPEHTPYFFISLVGAIALAILFGLALPTLTSRILRDVSWAKPTRLAKLLLYWWLGAIALAWGFDAYCQWFGLTSYMSIMVFLWAVVLGVCTLVAFRHYRKLNLVTTRVFLDQERLLLKTVLEGSQSGFFISEHDANDITHWRIKWANRAACNALGYDYARLDLNEMVGLPVTKLVAAEMLEKVREYSAIPAKTDYLVQLVTKQGGRQWADASGQTMSDYHGDSLRITYFNVVTKLVETIEDQRDQLLLANLMRRLDVIFPAPVLSPA